MDQLQTPSIIEVNNQLDEVKEVPEYVYRVGEEAFFELCLHYKQKC